MLYLFRLVSTDACTPTLRRAILNHDRKDFTCRWPPYWRRPRPAFLLLPVFRDDKNGLVRKSNSWMPIDLHVELLNLELKLIIYARRNGTFGADELFKDCILCDYTSSLRKAFEIHLSSPTSGEQTPNFEPKSYPNPVVII
jgi:hypothetical protein